MDSELPFSLPPQWETESLGTRSASFLNNERGLIVDIRAVFKGSRSRGHRAERKPTHYVIQLQQDWFAKGVMGERNMSSKVDTWKEALDVAREFMREFTREIAKVPHETVEATHRATGGDHNAAEQLLTTEVAAKALTDSTGYSDDLLLSVLGAETNDQYQFVAHRDGDTVTPIAGEDTTGADKALIQTIHAVFPVDRTGLEHVLTKETPITSVTHFDNSTVYRFLFGDARETDIVLPRGTQVISPEFEATITNVLEQKWLT